MEIPNQFSKKKIRRKNKSISQKDCQFIISYRGTNLSKDPISKFLFKKLKPIIYEYE